MSFTPCRPGETGVLAVGHQGSKDAEVERRKAAGFARPAPALAGADLKAMRRYGAPLPLLREPIEKKIEARAGFPQRER